MSATLKTRKPIDEITVDDLNAFPIWEFASDEEENEEQDETWVRPVNSKIVPQGEYSLSVSASFTTASGVPIKGFVAISTNEGVEVSGGALLFNGQYLFVPSADFWEANAEYANLATALGLSQSEAFPLRFTLAVPIEGQSQIIEGQFSA